MLVDVSDSLVFPYSLSVSNMWHHFVISSVNFKCVVRLRNQLFQCQICVVIWNSGGFLCQLGDAMLKLVCLL